ncbi:MAG: cation efflux family transporter [Gammaproteobacteria bacterium]|jgi:cation diffusion facilitator family transporter|nr:cation efflux family transporter [Gammaproteobacteria bacterium]|tara:strand:+ start:8980 stop:9891 length:912 start_codon:yes stop_codon:yes gene_type:complete
MSSNTGSPVKAILYAFLANLGIAIAKLATAIYTGSGSMLAEAIHSFADTGNQVLLFIGLKSSEKEPDADHPLGYGKLTYFWSFIVALMLFSVGGLFSIYEGVHKLSGVAELNQVWIGLVILGLSIIIESFSLAGAMREASLMRGDKPLIQWLAHTRNAEIVVVIGEDVAAIIGLVIAFCFLGMTWLTGNPIYDAVGSICIGVVLIIVALFLVVRLQGLLVGKSAEPDLRLLIDELIADHDQIDRVLNTITLQMGPKVMLAAKIAINEEVTVGEAVVLINGLERKLKQAHPEIGWCFIEPDNLD